MLIGLKAIDEVRRHFASAYAEQYTLLQMQRIMAPVSRELALSRRFANSVVTHEWLRDPQAPDRRTRFFTEAEGFRQQFDSNAYFIIDRATGDYYFNDGTSHDDGHPRYRLSPEEPNDAWYFDTMASTATYNINVNIDHALERTMVWVNVKIQDNGELLGLAGGGIDLSQFLDRFIRDAAPGLTPMIIDSRGALQAHPDLNRIAFSSGSNLQNPGNGQHIQSLVADEQQAAVQQAIHAAMRRPGTIATQNVDLEGEPQLLSVGYIPELQ